MLLDRRGVAGEVVGARESRCRGSGVVPHLQRAQRAGDVRAEGAPAQGHTHLDTGHKVVTIFN